MSEPWGGQENGEGGEANTDAQGGQKARLEEGGERPKPQRAEKFDHSQHLAARAPSGRLPAAFATRSGVEAPRGQEAGCITPGTAPHWPLAGGAAGPAPNWLGISSRRLIGYWPPLRSGLCHTHGRTWIWVLALG